MAIATAPAPASLSPREYGTHTDHELVERVRAGDDAAFELLYARYSERIAAFVRGRVGDHGRSEDVTQDVFVSALRRIRATDAEIAFKPWVYEIAKNACIDQFRRSRRAEEVSIDDDSASADYGLVAATRETPEDAAEQRATIAHLQGAFGGLSDAHHEILVLRELEGRSYQEIGERMSLSRPSVESTLFRARRKLTEEYEDLASGERCVRVRSIVDGLDASARVGVRDRRRVSVHVSHCQPCRRHALLAGVDPALLRRRPLRAKAAALIPLPAFLRRRVESGDAVAPAPHTGVLAHWSATLGDPAASGWSKAVAAAVALAVAGAGAGAVHHVAGGGSNGGPGRPAAPVQHARSAAPHASSASLASATSGATKRPAHRASSGARYGRPSRTSVAPAITHTTLPAAPATSTPAPASSTPAPSRATPPRQPAKPAARKPAPAVSTTAAVTQAPQTATVVVAKATESTGRAVGSVIGAVGAPRLGTAIQAATARAAGATTALTAGG